MTYFPTINVAAPRCNWLCPFLCSVGAAIYLYPKKMQYLLDKSILFLFWLIYYFVKSLLVISCHHKIIQYIFCFFQSKNCSLHVGQSLSHRYPSSEMTPILSKKSAPGLILATGTLGTTLKNHHTCLYVSVDAGINWFQVSCMVPFILSYNISI